MAILVVTLSMFLIGSLLLSSGRRSTCLGMIRIGEDSRPRVGNDPNRVSERVAVLTFVSRCFVPIPLELHSPLLQTLIERLTFS